MARKNKVGIVKILVHTALTFLTGGLWLLFLIIRACLK